MTARRFVSLLVFLLLSFPQIVSAGNTTLARVFLSPTQDQIAQLPQPNRSLNVLLNNVPTFPNAAADIATAYAPVEPGTQSMELVSGTDSTPLATDEVTFEPGMMYTVVKAGLDQPAIVINDTASAAALSPNLNVNILTIVSSAPDITQRFKIGENGSPLPPDRISQQSGYAQIAFTGNLMLEGIGKSNDTLAFNVFNLPNTSAIFSDVEPDTNVPLLVSYSTNMSVADWLEAVNQMTNPPFTFSQFLDSARAGGFAAALTRCEDYMWQVWTDAAFLTLPPDQQSLVSGSGAGTVVNNGVLNPATTAPWAISPTKTRGGTPLDYRSPFLALVEDSAPSPNAVTGNILMTISTTGSGVQNVINVVDQVPVSQDRDWIIELRLQGAITLEELAH